VNDALGVGLLEGLGDLLRDLQGLVDGDGAFLQAVLQVRALDQLEDEERCPVRIFEAMDGRDVRVVERGEEMGLAAEAGQALRILCHLGREHLDRHVSPELRVRGPVDLSHPAGPEGGGDAVVGEGLADHRLSSSDVQFTTT
jgi:hypothetical protein